MKKTAFWVMAGLMWSAAAGAETTVTVKGDEVSVQPGGDQVVVREGEARPAVLEQRVISTAEAPPTDIEVQGEIVQIDQIENEIVVRDVTPRDRRITGDRGIISTLKVGDYVQVDLRPGSDKVAHRIYER